MTLGDGALAERAAGFALAAGAAQAAALRHPERAAAWLRARTLRSLHTGPSRRRSVPDETRRTALAALGVDGAGYRGLAALSIDARAALVASAIERFDPIDVETILDAAPAASRHAVAAARDRYLQFAGAEAEADGGRPGRAYGDIAVRVRTAASRAFSAGEAPP